MRKFEYLLSIPKTVFLNFKLFGMKTAIKCPIYIHYKTQLGIITRNSVKIDKIYPGVVRIGFEGTEGVKNCEGKGFLEIGKNGYIHFKENANWGRNATIRINGQMEIGKNFSINCNSFISVHSSLKIGDDFLGGWNVTILDSDNHILKYNNNQNLPEPIKIGDHVWICSFVDIIKGSSISDNSVVGYRTLVNKKIVESNVLIVGSPAKVVKTDIIWEK